MADVEQKDTVAIAFLTKESLQAIRKVKRYAKDIGDALLEGALKHLPIVALGDVATAVPGSNTDTLAEGGVMLSEDEHEILRLIPLAEKELKVAIAHFEASTSLNRRTTESYRRITADMKKAINRTKKLLGEPTI